jgi:replicative DNA helicase
MTESTAKPLPHNLDAEQSVLGGVILRNQVLVELDRLEVESFYDHRHKVIWGAIRALEARRDPIDVVTLEAEIERAEKLDAIGGVAFLGELALRVPTADNTIAYAKIVEDRWLLRRLILASADLADQAQRMEWNDDPSELVDEWIGRLSSIERARPEESATIGELTQRRLHQLERIIAERRDGERALTGVPTGVAGLDRKLGGWQIGICNLLAARPAMGKSATAIASAQATAEAGMGVHVFSLEDAWTAYADRVLSRNSAVPAQKIRQGDLTNLEIGELFGAQGKAHAWSRRWRIDNRAEVTASDIVRTVRRHRRELETKLVVVDYAHLVKKLTRRGMRDEEALDEIVTTFARAAKDDDLAYLVLAQLNRKCEERPDKRPMLSDLRGSGAFEERCKVMVGQYRGVYYGGDPRRGVDYDCDCPTAITHCTAHAPTHEQWEQQVQLLLLKNNNGETGRIWAHWNGPTMEIS